MPLPDLIQIVPPSEILPARISVPGSKSITNRALLLAALGRGITVLKGALWSEDTQVMVDGLQKLGFDVRVEADPGELCNRAITVTGAGGTIPRAGTTDEPLELFIGNAGTAARFLAAFVCLGTGVYRLHGVPRMHDRPQAGLFQSLRQLGYAVTAPGDRLPALVHGTGPRPGICQVSIAESSQFASALLLCARHGGWQVEIMGQNVEESPYVEMTRQLVSAFPTNGGEFLVEPDASSGSYFVAAGWLLAPHSVAGEPARVTVTGRPASGWQIDSAFPRFWPLPERISRETDLGDSIMTAIAIAPCAERPVRFTELGRLRLQECERVLALRTELTRCGAKVVEEGDTLTVYPSTLHGAEIETYDDHRMAMCFAILGLKIAGIKIKNPACVKKTFPNFYQKLAAAPPAGLQAAILDPASGRTLGPKELFAA